MKNEFTTSNGCQVMIIDCGKYEVELFKSFDKDYYGNSIKFIEKKTKNIKFVTSAFNVNWVNEKDGGMLELKYRDRWGSEMIFIHYSPSDLKGMFDFIGKGYNIFDCNFCPIIYS